MVQKLTAAAALAMLAVSCAPPTKTPIKVRALVLSGSGQYEPTEVELKTVTDIVALEGGVVKLQGGAVIRLDSNDPALQAARTEEAFRTALLKTPGRAVTASYLADKDGVLWPADFHTWNLITTYYNFERAWEYFTTIGNVPQAELTQTTAYYFPEFTLVDSNDKPQRDNALFFSPVQGFVVLPFETIQTAPLAINASVLTHEYSHLVFNRRVYDGASLPTPITTWSSAGSITPGLNVIKALDEGLADFHAWVASCQSTFGCNTRVLYSSFSDKQVSTRDLSQNACMSAELYTAYTQSSISVINGLEYQVGTILASALFKSSNSPADRQVLSRAVLSAYTDKNVARPGFNELAAANLSSQQNFTLAVAVKAIVRHIPSGNVDLRQRTCSNLATALQIPIEQLTGGADDCPASTTTTTACPNIYGTNP